MSGTSYDTFLYKLHTRKYAELSTDHKRAYLNVRGALEAAMEKAESAADSPVAYVHFEVDYKVVEVLTLFYKRLGWGRALVLGPFIQYDVKDELPKQCITLLAPKE